MTKTKPLFDDEAGSWESLYRGSPGARWGMLQGYAQKRVRARLELCLSLLPPVRGKRVIELGCGPGFYAKRLIGDGALWAGFDLSGAMLSRCRDNTGCSRLIRGDVRAIPFAAGSADLVLCVGVLSYLRRTEIESLFRQVSAILKAGGIFLTQTVRFDPLTWIRCRLPRGIPRPLRIPGPFHPRKPRTITRLLRDSGLAVERVVPYTKFGFYPAGTVYVAKNLAHFVR